MEKSAKSDDSDEVHNCNEVSAVITIVNKPDCTGCCACQQACPRGCIRMESDDEGFLYPKVDHSQCTRCGSCEEVCPVANRVETRNKPRAYACINARESVRRESSSGGVFTSLAQQVILDGGVVFGAVFGDDFAVSHTHVETVDELGRFRGSKYVQSRIGDEYREAKGFLDQGKPVLFSGTPCQVSGLKQYLRRPYSNLLAVDLVCFGVPSPLVWERYVSLREKCAQSRVSQISFRHKGLGWKRPSMWISFEDGTQYKQAHDGDPFMRAFKHRVSLRPSCFACRFKTLSRQSDLTLADFWGIERVMPDMDDGQGTSLVLVHSEKGQHALDGIGAEMVECREVDVATAIQHNPCAIRSVRPNPERDAFFRDLGRLPFDHLVDKYCRAGAVMGLRQLVASAVRRVRGPVTRG